jgi:ubiquitin conjugation factor E4 B
LNLNVARCKIQVDPASVSSDGFLYNLFKVCLLFCDPIIDPRYSKLELIDSCFFFNSDLFDISELTKINATNEDAMSLRNEYRQKNDPKPANFVTEIFFITMSLSYYGFMAMTKTYDNLTKHISELAKQVKTLQEAQSSWAQLDPSVKGSHQAVLHRYESHLDHLIGTKLAMESALLNTVNLEQMIRFYNLIIMWVLKTASSLPPKTNYSDIAYGHSDIRLFPLDCSRDFSALPEWIIENICEFYLFVTKHKPTLFENNPRNEFITFCMVILNNSSCIKNPYLKSKLVEILFLFTLPLYVNQQGQTFGRLDTGFVAHPFAKRFLISSILNFYVGTRC